ncbi:hypothetical protein MLD38_035168 [Melastoma candidum]|uniref:Uncharacterized protein n=1 Tax=Melastoma candidum TaxID=119954 RepID=A0ACB9MCC1_9MYRT|nr:hypothetical protein MLD38_035168 [Melastoma candidum]
MLQLQSHHRLLLPANFPSSPLPTPHPHRLNVHRPPLRNPTVTAPSSLPRRATSQWLAEAPDATEASPTENGPVELPPSSPSLFATTDDPTPIQVATSVLLTGAISVFLFRSIRRRAKRAKELKLRTSEGKKTPQDEALARLNAVNLSAVKAKEPPSPVQALLGGIAAGIITVVLYKFTTTIEASLNRQAISDNLSVRQITITIRTIINGLCYLATCVFGFNSLGLILYAGQLALFPTTEASPGQKQSGSSDNDDNQPDSASGTEGSSEEDSASSTQ